MQILSAKAIDRWICKRWHRKHWTTKALRVECGKCGRNWTKNTCKKT